MCYFRSSFVLAYIDDDYGPIPFNTEDIQESEYAEVPLNVRLEDLASSKPSEPHAKSPNKYIKVKQEEEKKKKK
jgi:hypothetical protein